MVGIHEPKHCSVKLSDVIGRDLRLDASAFDVDAMAARDLVERGKYGYVLLGTLLRDAYYGPRLKRHYVSADTPGAIGFVGSSEMLDCYPHPVKYMVDSDEVAGLHVKENTVLVSRSGTIGNTVLADKTLSRCLVSEDSIRLECCARPGYVYAYLRTKVGRDIVRSNTFGAVIQHVEPDHLRTLPIPNAPEDVQEQIDELVMASYRLRDESNELIDEATRLLVEALGLPDIGKFMSDTVADDGVCHFTTKLSDLDGRLDGSYHIPQVRNIVEHLRMHAAEVTTVGDARISSDVVLPGRFKRVYVEEGYGTPFLSGKHLCELDPSGKKYISATQHKERIASQLTLCEGMVLVTCSGTIGKVVFVGKHWDGWVATHDLLRIVPADRDIAGYLYIWLSSSYGFELLTRSSYGAVVQHIDNSQISSVAVPLLADKQLQARINQLALDANAKRYEAYQLEQEALRVMNDDVIYAK